MTFAQFLRKPFLTEYLRWLLLYMIILMILLLILKNCLSVERNFWKRLHAKFTVLDYNYSIILLLYSITGYIQLLYYSCEDISNKLPKIKRSNYTKSDKTVQDLKFSRIIEGRTCSESGLLFQPKLIIVGQWVGG